MIFFPSLTAFFGFFPTLDTGVYDLVRHPMYAGTALLVVGMLLWLESYAMALLASVPIVLLMVRIPL